MGTEKGARNVIEYRRYFLSLSPIGGRLFYYIRIIGIIRIWQ